MVILISSIFFFTSLLVVAAMVLGKMSQVAALPKNGKYHVKKPKAVADVEKRWQQLYHHFFEKQVPLHKLLSKSRIIVLKTERQIDLLLQRIRKKTQELEGKKNQNRLHS